MNIYEILALIIISVIAIRFTFKFDLNQFLDKRRKIKLGQLKNICPHCIMEPIENNNIKVESLFSSPVGTLKWRCSQCGLIVESKEEVIRAMEEFKENPSNFLRRQKEFIKKAKKLKII